MTDVVRFFARFRVALGFAGGVAVLWFAAPTRRSIEAGLPLALCGELVRLWAAGHLNKSREVTRSGPYRFMAHPLYFGSSLIGVGLAAGARSWIVVCLVFLYLSVTLTAAITSEERFLREKFGPAYDEYRVQRVVDRDRQFSWSRAMANRNV